MTILNSATILVRIVSVVVLIYLLQLTPGAYTFSTYDDFGGFEFFPWISVTALALLFLLMWFLPKTVASVITPKHLHNVDVGSFNAAEIETAAIGIIGLWLFIWAIPDMVHNVFAYISLPEGYSRDRLETMGFILSTLIEGVLGAFLVIRSKGVSKLISKLRS